MTHPAFVQDSCLVGFSRAEVVGFCVATKQSHRHHLPGIKAPIEIFRLRIYPLNRPNRTSKLGGMSGVLESPPGIERIDPLEGEKAWAGTGERIGAMIILIGT